MLLKVAAQRVIVAFVKETALSSSGARWSERAYLPGATKDFSAYNIINDLNERSSFN